MKPTIFVVMVLAVLVLMGWQVWDGKHSPPFSSSSHQSSDQPADGHADGPTVEVEFTEQQNSAIALHNQKMDSLTKVEPIPVVQVANINQSIKLPELKSLTENKLTPPELTMTNGEAIESMGHAYAISNSNPSTPTTSSTTPVIESVSRQTGIPAEEIEAAFNQ